MSAKLAIIGGTSLLSSSFFSHLKPTIVDTPHGNAIVYTSSGNTTDAGDLIFIQRHHADGDAGASVYRPPHLINHRANLHAISQFKVSAILAVCSVGSLQPAKLPIGTLLLPDDYISLFCTQFGVHDDQRGHVVPGIDLPLRNLLLDALRPHINDLPTTAFHPGSAVYMQTTGPRFETPAESKLLHRLGIDIVGMTAANEATAAKEFGLRYAAVAMIDNLANGLQDDDLTHKSFKDNVAKHQDTVEQAVKICVEKLLAHKF